MDDPTPTGLTHLDADGNVQMVDVSDKDITRRRAVAEAHIALSPEVADMVFGGTLPKGDAVATVRIAAMMAAKRTADLIPLCHPLPIDAVDVEVERTDTGARIEVQVTVTGRTGVEMEAITAASIGAVTLYDMVKGVDRSVVIGPVQLVSKTGGKSGTWTR